MQLLNHLPYVEKKGPTTILFASDCDFMHFDVKTLRNRFSLKYCSIKPLREHGEETLAWCRVRAAAVSGHKHHMLPTTNGLQSHPTVKCRLRDLLCCYPFVQHMAAESSQSCASSSVGQPSVHHPLAFTGLASEGGWVQIWKADTNPARRIIIADKTVFKGPVYEIYDYILWEMKYNMPSCVCLYTDLQIVRVAFCLPKIRILYVLGSRLSFM